MSSCRIDADRPSGLDSQGSGRHVLHGGAQESRDGSGSRRCQGARIPWIVVTLIVGLASSEFAAVVSDRRLTDSNGGVVDLRTNKLVIDHGALVYGYTGLADLPGIGADNTMIPTNRWLVEALMTPQGKPVPQDTLARKATRAMTLLPATYRNAPKFQAFLGAGFGIFHSRVADGPLPMLALVSNYIDPATWKYRATPSAAFTMTPLTTNESCVVRAVGIADLQDLKELERGCRETLSANARDLLGALNHLVDYARWVAGRSDAVGNDLLATVLPREGFLSGMQVGLRSLNELPWGKPWSIYIPGDDERPVSYMADMVNDGGAMMGMQSSSEPLEHRKLGQRSPDYD